MGEGKKKPGKQTALEIRRRRMDFAAEEHHSFGVFSTVMDNSRRISTSADIDADRSRRDETSEERLHDSVDNPGTSSQRTRRGGVGPEGGIQQAEHMRHYFQEQTEEVGGRGRVRLHQTELHRN